MTRRAVLVTGVVVALALVLGAVGGWLLLRDTTQDCPIPTEAVDDEQAAFVPRDALVPAGSVGAERAPVIEAAERLPDPFGPVVSGRFYGSEEKVPQLVALDPGVVLAEPPSQPGGPATLQDVSLPGGDPSWTRAFSGGAASGGPVGPLFVTAVGGSSPTLLTVDAESGDLVACVAVAAADGAGDVLLLTDQAGPDVVLAATRAGSPATLSRVDPEEGSTGWEQTLQEPGEVGALAAGPDQAVVSRVGRDPVRLAEMATSGTVDGPTVAAYSLDDGSPTWTYPTPVDPATAATALGTDSETGETYLLEVRARGRGTTSRVVALDADGATRWSRDLGRGFWDGSLWDDLLVMQGPDPRGGALLRALTRDDGSPVWYLSSRDFPAPRRALQRFGPPATVGDEVVVTAPGGLALVDPSTGDATPVRTALRVDQVLPVGDHLVLRAGAALLVLEVTGD